jgi:soluble lytic murein transglycosylase
MQQRGFYPMAAAQRLGEEYTFRIDKAPGISIRRWLRAGNGARARADVLEYG